MWEAGDNVARFQPALTKTCTTIRAGALKLFYRCNTFEASICIPEQIADVLVWLKMVGPANWLQLQNLYLIDVLARFDNLKSCRLAALGGSAVFMDMGATVSGASVLTWHITL